MIGESPSMPEILRRPYMTDRDAVLMVWRVAKSARRTVQRASRRMRHARKQRRGWA